MRKELTLGLFGFGCVGQGLYHVLHETHGIKATIKKICIKNAEKKRSLPSEYFTLTGTDILHDPEIDVVVELIDDADAAFRILKDAFQHGKHVVTANKKMLAENLEEIYHLQKKYNRSVLYEGAVCGSIPIIRNLEEYYDNDLISGIEGIFNGSTNYILTKVFEEKKSYTEALAHAQKLGFAESDPSLDVKGIDPKYKLCIAITHAFGLFVKPEDVINIGIDKITEDDLKFASENGYTIKLVARAITTGKEVHGLVAPQFIKTDHSLYTVRNEFNAVLVEGAFSEKQLFVGKGAGSYPTGSAVLSDISALTFDYRYEYKKINQVSKTEFANDAEIDVVVRFGSVSSISLDEFEEVDSGFVSEGIHYIQGRITLTKLKEWSLQKEVGIVLAPKSKLISTRTPLEIVSAA